MSEFSGVFNDILYRIDSLADRVARLETYGISRYGQHIYKTGAQAILGAGWAAVTFDTSLWNNGTYVANTFTAPVAGRYLVVVRLGYTTASVSLFNTRINHNGTYFHAEYENPSVTGLLFVKNTTVLNMAKDETVVIEANNAGDPAAVNLTFADPYDSYFLVALL